MRTRPRPRVSLLSKLLAVLGAPAMVCGQDAGGQPAAAKPETVRLAPKAHRTWDILLPNERFADVAAGFLVPHDKGPRFAAKTEGEILRADLDGDGKLEALVEGEQGFLTLGAKSTEGNALSYSVRLVRQQGHPWQYSCGGTMVGTIGQTKIQLIDQNLNGSYDDYGEDAMVVGRDEAASFLSKVVSIDGKLLSIEVARDGTSLTFKPWEGESGELDLVSEFECKAVLDAAVVLSEDHKYSFNLAKAKKGLRVPAAKYAIYGGRLALGDGKATLKTGRAQPLEVKPGAKNVVSWGGPVHAEFAVQRDGGKVGFSPREIWYYGRLGEEYSMFMPLGKSPDFAIRDLSGKHGAPGEVLIWARFPGNC